MRFASYPIVRTVASIAASVMLLLPGMAVSQSTGNIVGFEDSAGKTLFLHDFKGKPVLINLWATWCAPCVAEMPSLAKLQEEYAAKGLVVLALSEDDSIDYPLGFYKMKNITSLPTYFDKGHAVWLAIEARGVPTTILVTPEGNMVERIEGPVDWTSPQVKRMIDQILNR